MRGTGSSGSVNEEVGVVDTGQDEERIQEEEEDEGEMDRQEKDSKEEYVPILIYIVIFCKNCGYWVLNMQERNHFLDYNGMAFSPYMKNKIVTLAGKRSFVPNFDGPRNTWPTIGFLCFLLH